MCQADGYYLHILSGFISYIENVGKLPEGATNIDGYNPQLQPYLGTEINL